MKRTPWTHYALIILAFYLLAAVVSGQWLRDLWPTLIAFISFMCGRVAE